LLVETTLSIAGKIQRLFWSDYRSSVAYCLINTYGSEIVLGIDNIFISISGKLPAESQNKARLTGLALCNAYKDSLLFDIFIMRLTAPLFAVLGNETEEILFYSEDYF
jgi:predicted tellurium resistance membrane protein TerC